MTKEDFWSPIETKSPDLFKKFKDWVDEYKERVIWGKLFHENTNILAQPAPKVHELPDAMQIGIFIQFLTEMDHVAYKPEIDLTNMESIKLGIIDWFEVEGQF